MGTIQKTVSFRIGDLTSKISIQPSTFKGLVNKYGSPKEARKRIKELVIEGKSLDTPDPSLYVQCTALLELLPEEISSKVTFKHNEQDRGYVKFTHPLTKTSSSLSTHTVLVDVLDVMTNGKGKEFHKKFAEKISANLYKNSNGDRGLSNHVREHLITHILEIA